MQDAGLSALQIPQLCPLSHPAVDCMFGIRVPLYTPLRPTKQCTQPELWGRGALHLPFPTTALEPTLFALGVRGHGGQRPHLVPPAHPALGRGAPMHRGWPEFSRS